MHLYYIRLWKRTNVPYTSDTKNTRSCFRRGIVILGIWRSIQLYALLISNLRRATEASFRGVLARKERGLKDMLDNLYQSTKLVT